MVSSSVVASSESPNAVKVVNARKIYGKDEAQVVALDGVSVAFAKGQFTAIMGPSGSGKSTLMHVMAGLDALDEGQVYLGEDDLTAMKERQRTIVRRDRIGFVFQAFNLVPTLNAIENITLPLSLGGKKPDESWLNTILDIVGLKDRLNHRPSELSGGQQQRVAVARALASRPEIVFADEPTGNLDSRSGGEVLSFMRRAVDEFDQTIVMVTHDAKAAAYADRVVFLSDGQVVDELLSPTAELVFDRIKQMER